MLDETARITQLDHGITAIDTDYVRPLLDASHLIEAGGRAAFVDTGTNASVPRLLNALGQRNLDVGDVDYVFLTHVHLDHAGGAGALMQALPNAKAVLHPRGAPHMIDPQKLIKGSIAVYGERAFREMYGELVPIPEQRVIVADDGQAFRLADRHFDVFYTEGHARHHYCLHDPASAGVFTGDSFGISYRELDTRAGEFIYPTTPVHFDPPEAHKAIDRILDFAPERLYLTHYSRVSDVERLAADMHTRIDDFVDIARRHANDDEQRTERMQASLYAYLLQHIRAHGVGASDDALRGIVRMDVELNTMGLEFWLDHGDRTKDH